MKVQAHEAHIVRKMDECCVPPHLRDSLKNYFIYYIPPGSFLEAVLSNDLIESFGRADIKSRVGLFQLLTFLWSHAPIQAWGSSDKYKAWLQNRKS